MKKHFLLLLFVSACQLVTAQSINFGITGGFNYATVNRGNLSSGNTTNYLSGLNGGVFANVDFGNWSIRPALLYTQKGFKASSTFTNSPLPNSTVIVNNYDIEATVRYHYLELPINILYDVKVSPGKVFFGGGPYVGYLLSGRYKAVSTTNGTVNPEQKGDYSIGKNKDLKRSDYGVNALVGFAFNNRFQISAGYGLGFTNIVADSGSGKIRNRVFNVSVAYPF